MGSWTGEVPLSLGDRDRESPARGRVWLETGWAGPVSLPLPKPPCPHVEPEGRPREKRVQRCFPSSSSCSLLARSSISPSRE